MTTHHRLEFRGAQEFPGSFGDGFGCSDELQGSLLPDAPLQPMELTLTLADAVIAGVAILATVVVVAIGG